MVHNYKKLKVWELAMEISAEVYAITVEFPKSETYGLISQIRRSSVSIPSNIAEGNGRNSDKEFSRFLSIALGSTYELETQILLSNKLKLTDLVSYDEVLNKISELQKMLFKLRNTLS